MRIISIINQKGGVGKTTSTINIAAGLAILDKKVLLIDLDPQAHLTYSLGIQADEIDKTIYSLLKGKAGFKECLIQKDNINIIPTNISFVDAEIEFSVLKGREFLLKHAISKIRDYDYLIIDCPPSLGLLTLNAFAASKEIFIPLQCNFLSIKGMTKLVETIELVKGSINPDIKLTGIIVTSYDSRRNLSKQVIEQIRDFFKETVFNTLIRYNVHLAEAPGFGQDIFKYAPQSNGAEDYMNLCKEIVEREEK